MRKLALGLAALAAIGLAMPSVALADTVVIHKHRNRVYNEAAPPPPVHNHSNKTVIIKHHDNNY